MNSENCVRKSRLINKIYMLAIAVLILIPLFCLQSSASTAYLLGDIDTDGTISSADARLALRYAVKLDEYNKNQKLLADANKDGEITSADARVILRVAVKLDDLSGESVVFGSDDEEIDADEWFEEVPDIFEKVIPEAPEIEAEEDTFTFTVYGYGHGVGLSQYGAVALAEGGLKYTDILAYYYTGTSVIFGEEYPETTYYVSGEVKTDELVARIVAQEIGGITKNADALKAQAVAVFTLLKYHNFNVNRAWDVGYAVSSYDKCSKHLKKAVSEVVGQYVALTEDKDKKPIQASYSAMAAGMSASEKDIWGGNHSYLVAVESPFEMRLSNFISTVTLTSEELKELIYAYNEDIVLSENPEEWLEILSHIESIDENRGYVTSIRVGDTTLKGYSQFVSGLMAGKLKSSCFTVVYTPIDEKDKEKDKEAADKEQINKKVSDRKSVEAKTAQTLQDGEENG